MTPDRYPAYEVAPVSLLHPPCKPALLPTPALSASLNMAQYRL
jgi:hypothetical protein